MDAGKINNLTSKMVDFSAKDTTAVKNNIVDVLYKMPSDGWNFLQDKFGSLTDLIQTTPYHNVDIITANGYLMRTNMNLLLNEKEDQILRFAAAMLEVQDVYDYCVVDCGLLLDMTVTNVLVATDLVILPVKIGGFEIEAIANMDEQLEDLRSLNDRIRMKILMTMRQKNQTSLQVEAWLKESSGQDCFVTAVRRSIIAEKATMQRVPLPKFSKNCIVTQDYRNVVTELLKDMEG